MKKQIFLVLALLTAFATTSSAWVIILEGGNADDTYYRVKQTPRRIECTGKGHVICPVTFSVTAHFRTVNMHDLVNDVCARITSGVKSDSYVYADAIPVDYLTDDRGVITITTKDDGGDK